MNEKKKKKKNEGRQTRTQNKSEELLQQLYSEIALWTAAIFLHLNMSKLSEKH